MVQIPGARDIGRVSARSGRIANSGPTNPIGEALAGFGQDMVKASYDLNDLRTQENVDKQNKTGFDLETKIAEFRDREEQGFLKARDETSESGIGFTRQFIEGYQKRADEFGKSNLEGLTDAQKARAKQSILGLGNSLYEKANGYERVAKTNFYDRTTNQGLDKVRTQINNNAAPYEELKRQGLAAIDAADMPEPWKAERRALWDADAAESKWQWKFKQNPQEALAEISGKPDARALLRHEEGFRETPYWDVNAWRIGYGSDTVTLADGSHVPVTQGMKITREDAERDLNYRLTEREGAQARQQVGAAWDNLNGNVQAALQSVAYNYGSLPNNVVKAVQSGDMEQVASAVEGLAANKTRRKREASIIRGTETLPAGSTEYDAIPYDRRQQLTNWGETQYTKQVNEQAANTRGQIEIAVNNAPTAIQNTGSYSGTLPTSEQFTQAYGPQDGALKYNQLMAAVETSQQAYKMQTMPVGQIQAIVAAAKPTASGDTAALDAARYDTLSNAAQATIKAREADPSAYVQQAFPNVAQAWQEAGTSGDYRAALTMTAAAQQQIGVKDMRLMPKQLADQTVAKFKDDTIPGVDRVNAVTGLVFATGDPAQRRAIFQQLVDAGLPDTTEGAVNAYARGDEAAGRRLMEAAVIDPSKLPGKSPSTPDQIDIEIQSQIMGEGQIGDIVYGLTDGSIENQETAIRDAKLLTNAVNIRVRNGEALDLAVQGAAKDLYGDIQAVTGNGDVNAQIVLPTGTDPAPVLDGLAGLLPTVRTRLEASMVVSPDAKFSDGSKAIVGATKAAHIENIMSQGYFKNFEDGYVFIDPYQGAAVAGPDGKPMIFSSDQITSAAPATELGPMDREAKDQTIQRTQQEVDQETYGQFAPLLDDLRKEEPVQEQPKTFNPGPINGGGGGGY